MDSIGKLQCICGVPTTWGRYSNTLGYFGRAAKKGGFLTTTGEVGDMTAGSPLTNFTFYCLCY